MRWRPGEVILWREVWRGRPWFVWPVRVVEDRDDLLSLYIPERTPFGFPRDSWPWNDAHPWNRGDDPRWEGHGPLVLYKPGCAYTVWVFWHGPEREFRGWYVNLQDPLRRTARGVDTLDHDLDVLVAPNGICRLKDEDALAAAVVRGRFSAKEADAIRGEADRVVAAITAGERWWSDAWSSWTPDPSWTAVELPPGWDE